jgi:hypothetical protein
MINYKNFIIEKKSKENYRSKIKSFINDETLIDWVINKCTNNQTTEGIQYSIWVANQMKEFFIDAAISYLDYDISKHEFSEFLKIGNSYKNEKIQKNLKVINDFININLLDQNPDYTNSFNDDINYVLDWLKSPIRTEKVNLSELNLAQAIKKSDEWHNSLKATGKITDEQGKVLIEFDDDFYWIDLQTTSSRAEADAMGHCGTTQKGDTLLSLRDKNKSPHVTVAYDNDGVIYQMKGRNNKKPIEKYYPYIYRLLVDPDLKPKYFGYEYKKSEDFNLSDFDKKTFNKVFQYNPNLIYKSLSYDIELFKGIVKKDYLDKDDIKKVLFNSDISIELFFALIDEDIFDNIELKTIFNDINSEPINKLTDAVVLKLFDKNIITREQLCKKFSELKIIDNRLYIDGDKDDLEYILDDSIINIIFSDDPFRYWDFPWYDMDSSDQVWSLLNKENKEIVINKILEECDELSYKSKYKRDEIYDFKDVKISKDMFKWKDNDDFYFVYNNHNYKIDDLIDTNKNELDELYRKLNRILLYAQEDADKGEYYNMCHKAIKRYFGDYTEHEEKIQGKWVYFLRFSANFIDFNDIADIYESYDDYEEFGSIWSILKDRYDDRKLYINDDYGVYGTINTTILNDIFDNEFE